MADGEGIPEQAAAATAAATEGAPAEPAAPTRRGGLRVLGRLGLFVAVFGVALLASWIYREQVREQAREQARANEHEAPEKKVAAEAHPPTAAAKKSESGVEALECLNAG